MSFYNDKLIDELQKNLPFMFTRETVCKLMGGIFSPRTLSNFDAAGNGPRHKYRIGKKVAYMKDEFIEWIGGMIGSDKIEVGKMKKF